MGLFGQGQPAAALPWFDQALLLDPRSAAAQHFKGYALCQLGRFDEGVPLMERSVAAQPRNGDFVGNLGMIQYVMGDVPAAIATLERAVRIAPGAPEPYSNLAMALRDVGEPDRALVAARRALQLRPEYPAARLNLALALLATGQWDAAWEAYTWRPDPRVNLRDLGIAPTLAHATRIADSVQGEWLTLHGEQGLGDAIFFMRWAPLLRARGARLRFWGDARLGRIFLRSGLVDAAVGGNEPPPDTVPERLVWIGDLPALAGKASPFPAPARLVPDAARLAAMREGLASLGPAPHIGITWRAGLPRAGKAVLAKVVDPAALGAALRGSRATLVSLQRDPVAGEAQSLAQALARPLADLSAANADLEAMLALMEALDDYVAVSNTNVHLRAGLGKPTRVLVPWPAEWRWTRSAERSPWFPDCPLYRASTDGRWDAALGRLAADLG